MGGNGKEGLNLWMKLKIFEMKVYYIVRVEVGNRISVEMRGGVERIL